jgi:hypothetical protein
LPSGLNTSGPSSTLAQQLPPVLNLLGHQLAPRTDACEHLRLDSLPVVDDAQATFQFRNVWRDLFTFGRRSCRFATSGLTVAPPACWRT